VAVHNSPSNVFGDRIESAYWTEAHKIAIVGE